MLSFSPIEKPKIDIELYGTDINIAPIDKVHIMDEDSFEHFTLEWFEVYPMSRTILNFRG